jgi:MarR family transcriptional regulator, multiple antibiotic resistance protein MarR
MSDIYDAKTFEPRTALGYLIGHTRKAMLEEIDRELAPLDLTAAQYIIISALAHAQTATAADLCNGMVYDPGAMTRLLDRLELKGFVRRLRLPGDRRRVTLELTEEGKALCPRMNSVVVRVLNRFLTGFSKKEVRELEEFLRRILANSKTEMQKDKGKEMEGSA